MLRYDRPESRKYGRLRHAAHREERSFVTGEDDTAQLRKAAGSEREGEFAGQKSKKVKSPHTIQAFTGSWVGGMPHSDSNTLHIGTASRGSSVVEAMD